MDVNEQGAPNNKLQRRGKGGGTRVNLGKVCPSVLRDLSRMCWEGTSFKEPSWRQEMKKSLREDKQPVTQVLNIFKELLGD